MTSSRTNLARKMFTRMWRSKLSGKAAKFKPLKYPRNPKSAPTETRQVVRAALRTITFVGISQRHPKLTRAERRKLSRAHAARLYRDKKNNA